MTHDELLSKIDIELVSYGQRGNILKHSFALRAVVELHKPLYFAGRFSSYYVCEICSDTYEYVGDSVEYPCPTIKAIEKELS